MKLLKQCILLFTIACLNSRETKTKFWFNQKTGGSLSASQLQKTSKL